MRFRLFVCFLLSSQLLFHLLIRDGKRRVICHLFRVEFLVFLTILSRHASFAPFCSLGLLGLLLIFNFFDDLSGVIASFERLWSRRALMVMAEVTVLTAVAVLTIRA